MITFSKVVQYDNDREYVEGACLSADSKPTEGIANGSMLIEMNTGKVYFFNEAGSAWVEFSAN